MLRKVVIALVLLSMTLWACPALAQELQWADLVTSVSGNQPATTRLYGYYASVPDVGQVFVVCDPGTGKETGTAYLPGTLGRITTRVLDRYERSERMDFDHPVEVLPVQVSVIMPNIPNGETPFSWPMDYGFARYVPGSDPGYWLIVACVTNPNGYAVRAEISDLSVDGWYDRWGDRAGRIDYVATLDLQPNETKYVRLNGSKQNWYLGQVGEWRGSSYDPGYSALDYNTRLNNIGSWDYPAAFLASGGEQGFFSLFARWTGTDFKVYPLIPMRLERNFRCSGYDSQKKSRNPVDSRGWPEVSGAAVYDPASGAWSVSVTTDASWTESYRQAASANATSAMQSLFAAWGVKVPLKDYWTSDTLKVGVDGSLTAEIDLLEPVWRTRSYYDNSRWGGWQYRTVGAYSRALERPAPLLSGWPDPPAEKNWQTLTHRGEYVTAGVGTALKYYNQSTDYYSLTNPSRNDWMDNLPVVTATPCFVERYTFTAVKGDQGYLAKEAVPGYVLKVEARRRPRLYTACRPNTVTAAATYTAYRKINGENERWLLTRSWSYVPGSGWQEQGEILRQRASRASPSATWTVNVNYNTLVSAANPSGITGTFASGSGLSVCSPRYSDLRDALDGIVGDGTVTSFNAGSCWINLPPVTLGPGVSTWVADVARNAAVEFRRNTPEGAEWQDAVHDATDVILDEIEAGVIPAISSTDEAVFDDGAAFTLAPNFAPGVGGVVCGAQKTLVHGRYRYDSKYDDYEWRSLKEDPLGFSGGKTDILNTSYFTGSAPAGGQIVRGGDEILAAALSSNSNRIQLKLDPGQRGVALWRTSGDGVNIEPPEYPDNW